MSKIVDEVITSVKDTIDVLEQIKADNLFTESLYEYGVPQKFPFGIWFRGHSSTNYDLNPSIFRKKNDGGYHDETNIFILSKLRLPHQQKVYESIFDWLCFMQHYEVPTRILDWSESILVALYFAVKDHEKSGDAELVVLNARSLNYDTRKRNFICNPDSPDLIIRAEMVQNRVESKVANAINMHKSIKIAGSNYEAMKSNLAKPVAVFPNRWNDRMVSQSSVFTVHGGKIYHQDEAVKIEERLPLPITLETINDERKRDLKSPILKYYIIPEAKKEPIKKTLFELGIHEATLFPEMDHQALYLTELWS